jgi:hypothetical protein
MGQREKRRVLICRSRVILPPPAVKLLRDPQRAETLHLHVVELGPALGQL